MSKWQDPVSWMMLQHDDPILFQKKLVIIAYFSINIRWHSQNVSSDSMKWLIKHLFPPSSCKKQINKQNSYLLLTFLQSGSVPELDMYESKPFFPGPFVHSVPLWPEIILYSKLVYHRELSQEPPVPCVWRSIGFKNVLAIDLHCWH